MVYFPLPHPTPAPYPRPTFLCLASTVPISFNTPPISFSSTAERRPPLFLPSAVSTPLFSSSRNLYFSTSSVNRRLRPLQPPLLQLSPPTAAVSSATLTATTNTTPRRHPPLTPFLLFPPSSISSSISHLSPIPIPPPNRLSNNVIPPAFLPHSPTTTHSHLSFPKSTNPHTKYSKTRSTNPNSKYTDLI